MIGKKDIPLNKLKMSRGITYELWLLLTRDLLQTPSILITDNPSSLEWALGRNKSFIIKSEVTDYSGLPTQYSSLNDTFFYTVYHLYQ